MADRLCVVTVLNISLSIILDALVSGSGEIIQGRRENRMNERIGPTIDNTTGGICGIRLDLEVGSHDFSAHS